MTSVLSIFVLCLAAVSNVYADCDIPDYTEYLTPNCAASNYRVKLPNYDNVAQFWECNSVGGAPQLTPCPNATYFTYPLQTCTECDNYIPAVHCSSLTIPDKPLCQAINSTDTTSIIPDTSASDTSTTVQSTTIQSTTTNNYPTPKYPPASSSDTTITSAATGSTGSTASAGSTESTGSTASAGSTGSTASAGSTESTGSTASAGSTESTGSTASAGSTESTGSTASAGSTESTASTATTASKGSTASTATTAASPTYPQPETPRPTSAPGVAVPEGPETTTFPSTPPTSAD